jgi:hypothetical protein
MVLAGAICDLHIIVFNRNMLIHHSHHEKMRVTSSVSTSRPGVTVTKCIDYCHRHSLIVIHSFRQLRPQDSSNGICKPIELTTNTEMRFTALALLLGGSSVLLSATQADGFHVCAPSRSPSPSSVVVVFGLLPKAASKALLSMSTADCGCGDSVILSGRPSDKARSLDPRQAIRKNSIYTVDGLETNMDELIGAPGDTTAVSIVVLMRSLG